MFKIIYENNDYLYSNKNYYITSILEKIVKNNITINFFLNKFIVNNELIINFDINNFVKKTGYFDLKLFLEHLKSFFKNYINNENVLNEKLKIFHFKFKEEFLNNFKYKGILVNNFNKIEIELENKNIEKFIQIHVNNDNNFIDVFIFKFFNRKKRQKICEIIKFKNNIEFNKLNIINENQKNLPHLNLSFINVKENLKLKNLILEGKINCKKLKNLSIYNTVNNDKILENLNFIKILNIKNIDLNNNFLNNMKKIKIKNFYLQNGKMEELELNEATQITLKKVHIKFLNIKNKKLPVMLKVFNSKIKTAKLEAYFVNTKFNGNIIHNITINHNKIPGILVLPENGKIKFKDNIIKNMIINNTINNIYFLKNLMNRLSITGENNNKGNIVLEYNQIFYLDIKNIKKVLVKSGEIINNKHISTEKIFNKYYNVIKKKKKEVKFLNIKDLFLIIKEGYLLKNTNKFCVDNLYLKIETNIISNKIQKYKILKIFVEEIYYLIKYEFNINKIYILDTFADEKFFAEKDIKNIKKFIKNKEIDKYTDYILFIYLKNITNTKNEKIVNKYKNILPDFFENFTKFKNLKNKISSLLLNKI